MKRFFAVLTVGFAALTAHAQTEHCAQSEAACVLQATWGAALLLPSEKQTRLAPAFLEIASLSGESDLLTHWESRFGQKAAPTAMYPDYGWEKAEPLLQAGGLDTLIETATRREAPLSFGRADALLSAGKRLAVEDPAGAQRLNEALLALSQSASAFEKPNLAHAAAELAMVRCDASLFDRAAARTTAPDNLRYRLWRARITGSVLPLLHDIRAIDEANDTRDVRRVLDGYRATLELGYCDAPKSQIGG